MQTARTRRVKKRVAEMYPVKKWLTLAEACSFLDMSVNHFNSLALQNGLTVSIIGNKKYYKVNELEGLIEDNILIRKII